MRKKTDRGIYNLISLRRFLTQQRVSIAGIRKFILKHLQSEISHIPTDYLGQRNNFFLASQGENNDVISAEKIT